jgi:hypothetical protein
MNHPRCELGSSWRFGELTKNEGIGEQWSQGDQETTKTAPNINHFDLFPFQGLFGIVL